MALHQEDNQSKKPFLWIAISMIPILIILGFVYSSYHNQKNITSYAQPAVRVAVDTSAKNFFRNWDVVTNDTVSVQYQDTDIAEIHMVLEYATEIRAALDDKYNFYYNKPISIVVIPSREIMREFFKWDTHTSAVGVFYGNRIFVLQPSLWIEADSFDELELEFRANGPIAHEYMHLLLDHKLHNNFPRWFTEGVAQYEEFIYQEYEWIEEVGTLDRELYKYYEMKDQFDRLQNQPLAYRQSFKFIEYLMERYGEERYWQLIGELEKRVHFEQAFFNAYDKELYEVWGDWTKYVKAFEIR
ncbi:hypothetical protein BHU72_12950 [Desulfuribacillus stibiiarsenatis]|uniref:Peptidase MA-like domain-containing protein n=1 Tax=Desulfuribacillus stibiiarsenatis TaxID=1390249 RepID=A0A1E5L908_9FIRM|nr:hypothetical protein [Desulfuribacillus stibiiarsenatis]OEH86514.1 hypothetical protein BHU72_12950 [Desulfuribacillus stibiiarsenatis]